jgi:ParB family chromosome partitioning protein
VATVEGHARALWGWNRRINSGADMVAARLTVRATEALVRRLRGKESTTGIRKPGQDPNWGALEDQLRTALGTKVRIARDGAGGTLEISFFSGDDLTRIADVILGSR